MYGISDKKICHYLCQNNIGKSGGWQFYQATTENIVQIFEGNFKLGSQCGLTGFKQKLHNVLKC